MLLKGVTGLANSEDPDQTAPEDLGLHCLPRPVCPITSLWYEILPQNPLKLLLCSTQLSDKFKLHMNIKIVEIKRISMLE